MAFRMPLPSVHSLRDLADMSGPYPMPARHMVLSAQRYCYGEAMVSFLEEFPPEEIFLDRDEFVARGMAFRDHLGLLSAQRPAFMERFFRRRLHTA